MTDEPSASATPAPEQTPGGISVQRILLGLSKVVAPTALLTALLYYFGWARTEAAADRAGLDQSLFAYGTNDYLIRSVSPLFRPFGISLVVVVILMIVAGVGRSHVERRVNSQELSRSRVNDLAVAFVVGGAAVLAIGAPQLGEVTTQNSPPPAAMLTVAGALLIWVAVSLTEWGSGSFSEAVRPQRGWLLGVVIAIVLVGLFAIVLRLAFEDGAGSINNVARELPGRPEVVVTSNEPLDIEHLPGVQPTVVSSQGDGDPRYRYRGLYLLVETNDRLFLVTEGFLRDDGASAVAVIPASNALRLDFVRSDQQAISATSS